MGDRRWGIDDPGSWPQRFYLVIRRLGLLPILLFDALTFQDIRHHNANALLISGALLSLLVCTFVLASRLSLCV